MAIFKKSTKVPDEVKKEVQSQTRDIHAMFLDEGVPPNNDVLIALRHDLAENRRGDGGLRSIDTENKHLPYR